MCQTPKVDERTPMCELLVNIPTGNLWEDAELVQCLNYVLASITLVVPEEYQPVFHIFVFVLQSSLKASDEHATKKSCP